jgi:hypothetical protein
MLELDGYVYLSRLPLPRLMVLIGSSQMAHIRSSLEVDHVNDSVGIWLSPLTSLFFLGFLSSMVYFVEEAWIPTFSLLM